MSDHKISDNAALYVLEQWYNRPEEERVRFRSFCFHAGLFGEDFKYVNNIKRVADCHSEPMKYIQMQMKLAYEEMVAEEVAEEEMVAEEVTEEEAEEEIVTEEEDEEFQPDVYNRLDVVIVRQGFTNMLLILLILVTSPFLAYNIMFLYHEYFRNINTYDTIYMLLDTPDVIYL